MPIIIGIMFGIGIGIGIGIVFIGIVLIGIIGAIMAISSLLVGCDAPHDTRDGQRLNGAPSPAASFPPHQRRRGRDGGCGAPPSRDGHVAA
jgi:hypothetical protein